MHEYLLLASCIEEGEAVRVDLRSLMSPGMAHRLIRMAGLMRGTRVQQAVALGRTDLVELHPRCASWYVRRFEGALRGKVTLISGSGSCSVIDIQ